MSDKIDEMPAMEETAAPAPGKLVKITTPQWRGTDVYHTLYLPRNYRKDHQYPVIVEFPGNKTPGICTGKPQDCKLGYYASSGENFILVSLPFVNAIEQKNQLNWWGDIEATVKYCQQNVKRICEDFNGDPSRILLTGFSRGAIATGYIGLHSNAVASLWAAIMPFAHFDGGSYTRDGAETRLSRIKNKPVLIIHAENDPPGTANSLAGGKLLEDLGGHPEYLQIPATPHTDTWIENPSPQRDIVRKWVNKLLA